MQIDKQEVLSRIKRQGYNVRGFLRKHDINPVTFYQTIGGDRGKSGRAKESQRILDVLQEEGFLADGAGAGEGSETCER